MKIRNKLLLNFGILLSVMLVVFAFSTVAMLRERGAKTALSGALDLSQATENVRHQMLENRLALSNYLLTTRILPTSSSRNTRKSIAER